MEKNLEKVSILVAVYNAERWLRSCLESLCSQTWKNIEVICVDDASTDGSWAILEEFASRDKRFVVLHLDQNSGQAHARNVALEKATGGLICFVDSDDWLSPDALEKAVAMFRSNDRLDSVLFDLCYCDSEGVPMRYFERTASRVMTGREAFVGSLTWRIHGVYMVRAQLHKEYPYDESSRTYSDDNTTRLHYLHSRQVGWCDGIYFYRQHDDSVTHKVDVSRFNYLKANASMKAQLLQEHAADDILSIYENERWKNCVGLLMFYFEHKSEFSPEERAEALQIVKDTWAGIETRRLFPRNHYKLGYMPLHGHWRTFLWQEKLYFRLRKIKGSV